MKFRLKRGLIYKGVMYRAGEILELGDGYAFSWLTDNGWAEPAGETVDVSAEVDDGLLATEGLPPLDEPPKKGSRNG